MALPSITNIEAAVTNAFTALSGGSPRRIRARAGAGSLDEVIAALEEAYTPMVTLTVTDTTDADLAAFFAVDGELTVALGRLPEVGDVFAVGGTGDTTDDALETAKGSAVAAGNLFEVTNVTAASEAVAYVGAAAPDFSSEGLTIYDDAI